MTFKNCNEACIGCRGPSNGECIKCNTKYSEGEGRVCIKLKCPINQYFNQETSTCSRTLYIYIYIYIFTECNTRCSECSGGSDRDCKTCAKGYIRNSTSSQCLTCNEYSHRYLNPSDGTIYCSGTLDFIYK